MLRGCLLFCLLAGLAPLPAAAAEITGPAEVVDGDTLIVGGQRLRLYGIDAPEMDQLCATKKGRAYDCGRPAARALRLFLSGNVLRCRERGRADDGTLLATCHAGRRDLAQQMVLEGCALADPNTGAAYRRSELAARVNRDGLFKGKLLPPWEWRAGKREIAPGVPAAGAPKANQ